MRIKGKGVTMIAQRNLRALPASGPIASEAGTPAGRPRMDWSRRAPLVYVSGCRWSCTGGAQRPVALAKALQDLGQPVIYANAEETFALCDGVLTCSLADLTAMLPDLAGVPGTVIAGLPGLWHYAAAFGPTWRKCYDYFDDWAAYCKRNMGTYCHEQQVLALEEADAVICSAHQLKVTAECDGADPSKVHLIRNAGPDSIFPNAVRPRKGSKPRVVFVGSLWGSWVDWSLMSLLALRLEAAGCELHIIGGWGWNGTPKPGVPQGRNVIWHGQMPYPDAMAIAGECHVGVVPFRDPDICRGVDALKPYDYRGALCWTVGTDLLPELQGTPWTTVAPPGEAFCDAVMEALYLPMPKGEVTAYLRRNSWRARAEQLLSEVCAS